MDIAEVKEGRRKRFRDNLLGVEYEYDYDTDTLTNVTFTPEQVVKIRSFEVKHTYVYKFKGEIKDMRGNKITIFEVVDTNTKHKRLTLKDEETGKTYPLSGSNIAVLLEEILSLSGGKGIIDLSEEEKWMLQILNERYAFGLVKMLLKSENYTITVKEVANEFKFNDIQKARNVLAKFKRLGFLISKKKSSKEMIYTTTVKREELTNFIKKILEA